ncbi:hypothetical protein [Sulfuritalea hydrogenivorans]|jgi:hypothetical protein|uniref:hypothetical protein n=1 Tax=Sulfuritalea hydrogenivorans TaxID=748811 RepID=UPI000597DD5D|nr:hypothetical protein [Sulfuritalea hydrogenivorans]
MRRLLGCVIAISVLLSGCVTLPPNAFVVTPEQLARRQIETRRYDGAKEESILVASSNVLQDLGYTLDNSETKLGVLTASKQRDATHGGEVAAAIIIALLGGGATPVSKDQTIRVSLVVRPLQATKETAPTDSHFVRITFQRVVRRTDNSLFAETLSDNELYEGFFEKLSKSIFLEAQKI